MQTKELGIAIVYRIRKKGPFRERRIKLMSKETEIKDGEHPGSRLGCSRGQSAARCLES